MNWYEFFRVLAYLFGVVVIGQAAMRPSNRNARYTLLSVAGYFLMWTVLIVYQWFDPAGYRVVSNWISTPYVALMVLIAFLEWARTQ